MAVFGIGMGWILAYALFLETIIFFIILMVMGSEGRFILGTRLLGKKGGIALLVSATGSTFFYFVRQAGRALKAGGKRFLFLPEFLIVDKDEEKEKADRKFKFNELLRRTAYFIGRPFFVGTRVASIACTPHMAEAIARAKKRKYKEAAKLLERVKEVMDEGQGKWGRVKEVDLIDPWNLDDLSELVNISFTEQDIDESQKEGYIMGLNTHIKTNKVLLIVIGILVVCQVVTLYIALR